VGRRFVTLAAMLIYLMSGDLAWSPGGHPLLDDSGAL